MEIIEINANAYKSLKFEKCLQIFKIKQNGTKSSNYNSYLLTPYKIFKCYKIIKTMPNVIKIQGMP